MNTVTNNDTVYQCDPVPSVLVRSGEERFDMLSTSPTKSFNTTRDAMPQLDFRHRIAFDLADVPEVQAVFTSEYGKVFFVWTVVAERDLDLYTKIHEKERQIINANDSIQFDFTVMASRGKNPRTLVTDETAQLAFLRN